MSKLVPAAVLACLGMAAASAPAEARPYVGVSVGFPSVAWGLPGVAYAPPYGVAYGYVGPRYGYPAYVGYGYGPYGYRGAYGYHGAYGYPRGYGGFRAHGYGHGARR